MQKDEANKDCEVNQTLLSVNFKVTQTERLIGAAFINLHERKFQVTEFSDNEHFSGLESLVIQLNNEAADSKFRMILHLPNEMLREKIDDTLKMCEVEYDYPENKKDFSGQHIQSSLEKLLKENFAYMITESEMDLALGALNAGIISMSLLA